LYDFTHILIINKRSNIDTKNGTCIVLSHFSCCVLFNAEVAKWVDKQTSGASGGNYVEVQVLSSAPNTICNISPWKHLTKMN